MQTNGVFRTAVVWGLLLCCEYGLRSVCDSCGVTFVIEFYYKLKYWVGQLRIELRIFLLNTDWRSEKDIFWVILFDWVLNSDWRSEWDDWGLRFVVGLWIQTVGFIWTTLEWLWIQADGLCGSTVEWDLWLDSEYGLTEWMGRLWNEVCDFIVNTDRRNEKDLLDEVCVWCAYTVWRNK
jgi:hypothetical protein